MSPTPKSSLQLTKFYPPVNGGIETAVRDIAEGLLARDWKVEVLCSNLDRETLVEPGRIPVIRASSWGQFASTSMSPSLIGWLRQRQDSHGVIHVHLPNPMANLAIWLTRPTSRLVVHWHSDIVKQKHLLKLYEPLQNWLLRRADAIIATSPPYAESSPWLQAFREKVHFVPLCVQDARDPASQVQRQVKAQAIRAAYPGKKIIFSLGRMTYYKGFDILVESARLLGDDSVVLIGGGGELLDSLRAKVQQAGLTGKVHFLGRVSDEELPAYYEAAHIFCLPSLMRSEAFGLVLLEAMSFARPIVATHIVGSGVPWVNVHEETGLNAEPGDPVSLASALQRLLDHPDLAHELGEGGRKRYEAFFTLEKMTDALLKVYRSIGA